MLKPTGPITKAGKRRSRCNAIRHSLAAETMIGALDDAEEYRALEAAVIADHDAQSAVERELVLTVSQRIAASGALTIYMLSDRTAGRAAPTLTITHLALRLAGTLSGRLAG
jgi:hypothetical protein